jgi:hypothetical protein
MAEKYTNERWLELVDEWKEVFDKELTLRLSMFHTADGLGPDRLAEAEKLGNEVAAKRKAMDNFIAGYRQSLR